MLTLVTVCSIQQLPEAILLGNAIKRFHPDATFVIGLADDIAHLINVASIPFPLLTVTEVLGANEVARLSQQYTPTEFVAAVKPALLKAVYEQVDDLTTLVYADPTVYFYNPLNALLDPLQTANLLLTPHVTKPPNDRYLPDEKQFQNVGLYSAGFLALRRSAESERFLGWWDSRVRDRAYIDFCEGFCIDQIWLMHVPAFFDGVRIIHDLTWHAALWNFHERRLTRKTYGWFVIDQGYLQFVNFKGLTNSDEGFFPYQTRLKLRDRPDLQQLIMDYRQQVQPYRQAQFEQKPAYGLQPEPVILRGWRKKTVDSLRKVNAFIDTMPIPVLR